MVFLHLLFLNLTKVPIISMLAELPLETEGFCFVVGAPVGHLPFVRNFTAERLATLHDEFQNLLPYPRPHDFLLCLLETQNRTRLAPTIEYWI